MQAPRPPLAGDSGTDPGLEDRCARGRASGRAGTEDPGTRLPTPSPSTTLAPARGEGWVPITPDPRTPLLAGAGPDRGLWKRHSVDGPFERTTRHRSSFMESPTSSRPHQPPGGGFRAGEGRTEGPEAALHSHHVSLAYLRQKNEFSEPLYPRPPCFPRGKLLWI